MCDMPNPPVNLGKKLGLCWETNWDYAAKYNTQSAIRFGLMQYVLPDRRLK